MQKDCKICVGMIMSTHGVRGLVRLRSFMEDPHSITAFDELTDESGARSFAFNIKSAAKDFFIAEVKGVKTKEDADALRSTKLFVPRAALPKTKKAEYYESDLVGLKVKDEQGKDFGTVQAVHNYGGGPFLEIGTDKKNSFMLPFTAACVPDVDVKAVTVTVVVPEGWLKEEKPENAEKPVKKAKV